MDSLDCGGKCSATPLWLGREAIGSNQRFRTCESAVAAALCQRSPKTVALVTPKFQFRKFDDKFVRDFFWTNYFVGSKVKIVKQNWPQNLVLNNCSFLTSTIKIYFNSILAASALALAGCSPAAETNVPANDTWRLDDMVRNQPPAADFVARVKLYYQSLEKKDWPTSYDMRTANFKQDVTRDYYLKEMADSRENLTSYKVLNVHLYGDEKGGETAAEIIMEFHEGGMASCSCARWIKRGGNWICDEPGLSGLLTSTRIPDWTTN